MNNGWVKLHRDITETKLWSNPDKLRFYLLLLFKAGHGESKVYGVDLKKGQFLTGRNSLADEFNKGHRANWKHSISSTTVYKWLHWLKRNNLIELETTSEYTVVTVFEAIEENSVNTKVNNSGTSSEHQRNIVGTSMGHL